MFRNQTALKIQTVKIRCLQKYTSEWYSAPCLYNYFFSFFLLLLPHSELFYNPCDELWQGLWQSFKPANLSYNAYGSYLAQWNLRETNEAVWQLKYGFV